MGASVVFAIGGIPTPAISRAFAVEWLNSTESSVSATHLAYGYLESNMISFYARLIVHLVTITGNVFIFQLVSNKNSIRE